MSEGVAIETPTQLYSPSRILKQCNRVANETPLHCFKILELEASEMLTRPQRTI